MITVDAAIITADRPAEVRKCIESIAARTDAGIIVVVNGYDEGTVRELTGLSAVCPRLSWCVEKEPVAKSRARNIAVSLSHADVLYFIDDDAFVETDIASAIRDRLGRYPEAAVVGGPNLTPDGSTLFSRLAGYVLSSLFTAWRMRARFARGKRETECSDMLLTLCNLAVKREMFTRERLAFDERLHYNEENLFIRQVLARGYRAVYVPEMTVRHERRRTVPEFFRQVFESGRGRAKMTRLFPGSFSPVYGVPSIFCVYLAAVPVLAGPALLPLALYLTADVANALVVTVRNRERVTAFPALLLLAPLAHIAYGLGFYAGLGQPLGGSE